MSRMCQAVGRSLILAFAISAIGLAIPAICAAQSSVERQPTEALREPPLPLPSSGATRLDKANAPVQFLAPAQVTVPAHHPATVNLQFGIAKGLHINSHAPHVK